jgi:hypothetical protein
MLRRRAALAMAAALCTTLAGCAAPTTGLPDGVTASLSQQRSDVASRQAQVRISNETDAAIEVGAVSVTDPRFDGAAVRVVDRTSSLAAGASVDVRVQLPPMDCEAPDDAASTLSVVLTVEGIEETATADLPDTLGFLPALHVRECLAHALAEVADVRLAAFVPAGETASLELAVTPTGEGAATLVALHPTPLLMYGRGAELHPIGVEVGAEPTTVRVPLVPQRCDPHVVQEDKRGTIFTFDVVVDGVEGSIDIPADADMKGRMLTWVAEACGFGG